VLAPFLFLVKCPRLLSPKVVEKLGYVMGIVRERSVIRSHHAVKHERR
jgi:hypothetical protein